MTLVEREIDPAFGLDVGRGWFPVDAESHRRDAPKFCPSCAAPSLMNFAQKSGTTVIATT